MEQPLRLGSRFFKGHGHGNDYLVFEEGDSWPVSTATVQRVCHPHRGVGADGIVAVLSPSPEADTGGRGGGPEPGASARVRMFNPDGSEFERSGNGLRVLAAFLHPAGRVLTGVPFPVEVGGEEVTLEVRGREESGELDISVDMGPARFGPSAVGADLPMLLPGSEDKSDFPAASGSALVGPDGSVLTVYPVAIGNPHCVVFRPDLREQEFLELGPFLTRHPAFPGGANVQVGRIVGPEEVEILIWERGVGRTSSSGTSACAVAAAGVQAGLLSPGLIRVRMEGGEFRVTVDAALSVRLRGPVQNLFSGDLAEEFLKSLRS